MKLGILTIMETMSLNWESTYAIALELRRKFSQVNLEEVSLNQVFMWAIALDGFEDDPALANDGILQQIYQDWFEEILHDR